MNAEEVADAVPDGADPAGHLVSKPRCKALDTFPQPLDNVAADLHDLVHEAPERFHDALDDLRYRLDDLDNDGRKVLDQGDKQLHARHDDLVDVVHERVYNTGNDLRDRLDNRRDDLRQRADERDEQVDARLYDLRDRIQHGGNDSFDDKRDRFYDSGYDLRQRRHQRGQKLYPRVDELRNRGKNKVDDREDQRGQRFDQDGYRVKDTLLVGQSVKWTPAPAGGEWSYDNAYLSLTGSGGKAVFKALKEGKTTATYTAGGTEYVVHITINAATLPQTGDSGSPLPYILLSLASLCGLGAVLLWRKRSHA